MKGADGRICASPGSPPAKWPIGHTHGSGWGAWPLNADSRQVGLRGVSVDAGRRVASVEPGAVLGTAAWAVVASTIRAQATRAAAAHTGRQARPSQATLTAIYHHALARADRRAVPRRRAGRGAAAGPAPPWHPSSARGRSEQCDVSVGQMVCIPAGDEAAVHAYYIRPLQPGCGMTAACRFGY